MNDKGALEISFAWLFAIIVGAFILFLAIFLSTKIVNVEQTQLDAETAKQIGVLLNPLETGYESGSINSMIVPSETRIYNRCDSYGNFGDQIIKVSQKSFNKWTDTEMDIRFSNKYIFSENYVEGRKFYLFSKPFSFPFKVVDLIYMTSANENYCFLGLGNGDEENGGGEYAESDLRDIRTEILDLKQPNFYVDNCTELNSKNTVRVCFDNYGIDCNVNVYYNEKMVKKSNSNEILYFETNALMYAAIFSDKETYECQLKRIMSRLGLLAELYTEKADLVSVVGCNSETKTDLIILGSMANSLENSGALANIAIISDKVEKENEGECSLW